jgi:uncharacterized cupin superfamily protein
VTIAESRLVSADIAATPTAPDGSSSALATASVPLVAEGQGEVGIWEAGPGIDTDVETDEIFVVLYGSGSVTFADGSRIELRPGTLVRLRAGDRTTWQITERLRKLYFTLGAA